VEGWLTLRTASAWERLGTGLSLPFAGLHVVEACKQRVSAQSSGENRVSRISRPSCERL
jgi:hypothetical protein